MKSQKMIYNIKKMLSLLCLTAILSQQASPIITFATEWSNDDDETEPDGSTGNPVGVLGEGSSSSSSEAEDDEIDYEINSNANFRTMAFLDVAKIVDGNNILNSDYRPHLEQDRLMDMIPEYKFADIKEFNGFYKEKDQDKRNPIVIDQQDAKSEGYGSKLEYLINKNILNRTTNYMYDGSGIYMSNDRVQHHYVMEGETPAQGDSQTGVTVNPKFYSASDRVSKADFIANLMKLDKINPSRVLAVQIPYSRTNVNLINEYVETEPIESSPYQSYMGELGIDSVNNDIIINHGVFRQLYTLQTNDVIESYLEDALLKGIIKEEEIGGAEGTNFLGNRPRDGMQVPGSWYEQTPVRQFYNQVELSTKELEQDGKYPANLGNYMEEVKHILNEETSTDGLAYPWGDSYSYSVEECIFGDPYSKQGVEILKRPSIIEVNNGYYDANNKDEKGYQYFTKEEMTLAEGYVYAYKFLKANAEESMLTQQDVDYLNSAYGLDFDKMTEEEIEAARYLVAKGIVDPENHDIKLCTTTAMNNADMVELLYRILNKDARYEYHPELSDLDKEMLDQGYSQADIQQTQPGDVSSSATATISYGNRDNVSLQQAQLADRIFNTANYNYVYIRYPKDSNTSAMRITLMTDDKYRQIIAPYNKFLDGGKAVETVDDGTGKQVPAYTKTVDTSKGEYVYCMGDTNAVYQDLKGYVWGRYIVHKDSNVQLNIRYKDGNVRTYKGISGEGVYYLVNDTDKNFKKVACENANEDKFAKDLYNKVILNDFETRTYLQQNVNKRSRSSFDSGLPESTYQPGPGVEATQEPQPTQPYSVAPETGEPDEPEETPVTEEVDPVAERELSSEELLRIYQMSQNEYGDPQMSTVYLGRYTKNQMEHLTYHNKQFLTWNGNGFDIDRTTLSTSNTLQDIGVEGSGDEWYITYQTTSLALDKAVGAFLSELGTDSDTSDSKMPGYCKITKDNEEVVMISKEQLEKMGIVFKAGSEKVMTNPRTGQRMQIITDEHFTLCGNNITRYSEDTLMATATGEYGSNERKVFYNLNMMLELLNDTAMVENSVGKDIYLNPVTDYEFGMIPIFDASASYKDVHGNVVGNTSLRMDTSYGILQKGGGNAYGSYISLSALSSGASNMIFFKDNTIEGLNILLVYTPKDIAIGSTTSTNNGLFSSMKDIASGGNVVQTEARAGKKVFKDNAEALSQYFFTAGGGENLRAQYLPEGETYNRTLGPTAKGVLPSNYQYDLYFLVPDSIPKENVALLFDEFRKKIMETEKGSALLNNALIDSQLDPNAKHTQTTVPIVTTDDTNVKMQVAMCVSDITKVEYNCENYFYIEPGTKNLYFRTSQPPNADGKCQSLDDKYKAFFKNRLYMVCKNDNDNFSTAPSYNPSPSPSVNPNVTPSIDPNAQDLNNFNFTEAEEIDEPENTYNLFARFRPQRYYYNCPEDYVPLEQMCMASAVAGTLTDVAGNGYATLTSKEEFPIYIGKIGRFQGVHAGANATNDMSSTVKDKYNVFGSNILVPFPKQNGSKANGDVGMYTVISSVPRKLTDDEFKKSVDAQMIAGLDPSFNSTSTSPSPSSSNSPNNNNNHGVSNVIFDNTSILHLYNGLNIAICNEEYNKYYKVNTTQSTTQGGNNNQTAVTTTTNYSELNLARLNNTGTFSSNALTSFKAIAAMYNNTWRVLRFKSGNGIVDAKWFWNGGYGTYMKRADNSNSASSNSTAEYQKSDYAQMPQGATFITIHLGNNPPDAALQDDMFRGIFFKHSDEAYGAVLRWKKNNDDEMQLIGGYPLYEDENDSTIQISKYSKISSIDKVLNDGAINEAIIEKLGDEGYAASTNDPIYFTPQMVIPAGTTVVNPKGYLEFRPTYRIRTEVRYISNIINSLIARAEFEEGNITYLMQLGEGATVKLNDTTFIKMTGAATVPKKGTKVDGTKGGQWQSMLMCSIAEQQAANTCFNYHQIQDYTLMYYILLTLYDQTVPDILGAQGSQVQIGNIAGNGVWRLPTIEELNKCFKVGGSSANYPDLNEILDKSTISGATDRNGVKVWTYDASVTDLKDDLSDLAQHGSTVSQTGKVVTVEPKLVFYEEGGKDPEEVKVNLKDDNELGVIMPVVELPPTMVVERVNLGQNNGTATTVAEASNNVWRITGYVDQAIYGIDPSNDYVVYLKTRDTPVENPMDILELIRNQRYDGSLYRDRWNMLRATSDFYNIMSAIETIAFIVCMVMLVNIVIVGPAVYCSPVLSSIIRSICQKLRGIDIPSWLTGGIISIYTDATITRVFVSCLLLSTLANVFLNNTVSKFLYTMVKTMGLL